MANAATETLRGEHNERAFGPAQELLLLFCYVSIRLFIRAPFQIQIAVVSCVILGARVARFFLSIESFRQMFETYKL